MAAHPTTELHVTGMTCNNCARKVTEAAQKIPGVHSVSVSVATERASIRWTAAAEKNLPAVLATISRAGFSAREISSGDTASPNRWQWSLILGLAVTVALMIGEWIFHLMMEPWFQWLSFALAAVVQIFCGAQFYRGAWRQFKVGSSNMDTLVALGSTTAFGLS
jgi:Cu+-exporting ATPase